MTGWQRTTATSLRLSRIVAAREFANYTLVSGIALLVDYLVYWAAATRWDISLPIAASIGYLTGLALSYVLVRGRVFREGWLRARPVAEAALYVLSGLLGLALTYVTTWTVVWLIGEELVIAKSFALIVSFVGVYAFRSRIVFRRPAAGPVPAESERTTL